MAKSTQTVLEKRMTSIKRGAYWFGVIGRLSMLGGFAILIFTAATLFIGGMAQVHSGVHLVKYPNMDGLGYGLQALVDGWLFLLGRDAFVAIEALIKEMQEIV